MSTTAFALVIGTAAVLLFLVLSTRAWAPDDDEGSGLLAGSEDSPGPRWLAPTMRVVVSLAILGASLYVILSNKFAADTQKWAFGAAGTILGFWLHEA